MTFLAATMIDVINGSTVDLNVDIGGGQIEEWRCRILGVQMQNINKQYHSGFKGATGVQSKLLVKQWFFTRSSSILVESQIIDICGRKLCIIKTIDDPVSINEFLVGSDFKNTNWETSEQEVLIEEWFEGEVVTIPGGDELPIFHNWGKPIFIGYNSIMLEWLGE